MPVTIDGTNGITTPTYGGTDTSEYLVPVTAFKNRIINGAMQIDQRNNGSSVTPTAATYTIDRWTLEMNQSSKFSIQRNAGSVTPPVGFSNYLGVTSLSSYSLGSGDFFSIRYKIEGFNVSDLAWGTANASTVTISFWARSSLTGTFGGTVANDGFSRMYPFTYSISSANTWEYKTVTISGDTTGTWLTNNSVGLILQFGLGYGSSLLGSNNAWNTTFPMPTGSTSVVGTNGATFYITGVQLEKGSTATSFDYRPYSTELALCQRYYWRVRGDMGNYGGVLIGTATGGTAPVVRRVMTINPVTMRTAPTINFNSANVQYGNGNGVYYSVTSTNFNSSSTMFTSIDLNGATALTAGQCATVIINSLSVSDWIDASAEL